MPNTRNETVRPAEGVARRRGSSPLSRLLDTIGSIWFGVTMMVSILVYAWVGSAGVPVGGEERFWFVRQTFEKTEMEWFSWWPFHVLLALLSIALILVTLRRIRFNLPNIGVWTVHAGILVLIAGCVMYFGLKLEGDVAVYRRQAVLTVPGGSAALVLKPGARTLLRGDDRAYEVTVASLQPDYEMRTGDDAGSKTYAAQLMFRPLDGAPGGETFVRQLLVGHPEYTEDVLPGRGRAIKAIGRALVDETVEARLEHAPSDTMHLRDRMALFARVSGEPSWSEMPLRRMPRYNEYASPSDGIRTMTGGVAGPYPPLSLASEWKKPSGSVPGDLSVRVTGFLPFAHVVDGWATGGTQMNPYARVRVRMGESSATEELLAAIPGRSRASLAGGALNVNFKWVESEEGLARWLEQEEPRVTLRVPGRGVVKRVLLAELMEGDVVIGNTGYRVRGLELYPDWTLASSGERASMALVAVEGPRGSFRRAVVWPRVELSQDLDESGRRHSGLLDEGIAIELESIPESGLFVVGGEAGLHVLLVNQGGGVLHEEARIGEAVQFLEGRLEVVVEELSRTARRVVRPVVIPERERDLKAGAFYSVARVEVSDGQWRDEAWLRYSHYAHQSVLGFHPQSIPLPDGRELEILLSRETYPLPNPVVLETFKLETYPGRQQERDYISLVRFVEDDGTKSKVHEVRSNQPSEHEAWWFFQATWDPPRPRSGHAGMNYTGLGVGNRHGVLVMLFGSAMTVLGTLWAFYAKPVVLRRIRDRARARAGTAAPAGVKPGAAPAMARGRATRAEEGA